MNISYQPISNFSNSVSFTAIPLARYGYLQDKDKDVIVYRLEKKDIDYLKNISENIDAFYRKYEIEDDSTKQVVKEAVDAGIEILSEKHHPEKKAKVLLAISDEVPSAILIGNTLKKDKKGRLHYSSRKNHSKDETELDWLATWNKKILGEGKVIVCEYFRTVLKDNFKQVYVRSEIPEKSFAFDFYKKMGFRPLSENQREILRENDNGYLIGEYDAPEDSVIPMKITIKGIKAVLKKRCKELMRKDINSMGSVDLPIENYNKLQ